MDRKRIFTKTTKDCYKIIPLIPKNRKMATGKNYKLIKMTACKNRKKKFPTFKEVTGSEMKIK